MTRVIFRKFPDGEIIALFPEIVWSAASATIQSYVHMGQHGPAHYEGTMRRTVAATPEEYDSLRRELVGRGYDDLNIRKRR